MSEPIDVDPLEAPLVPVSPDLIHSAPVEQVVAVQDAYHALCNALLDESDYQTIGDKQFRKKSGWRKLAVAFNVSTELVKETEIRGSRNRIEEVKCLVRATAPNGRYQEGLGVCSIYERCCDPGSCRLQEFWPDTGKPTGHVHCGDTCNGRHHFSNAAHDIPSTAMTRATNRALADLFGMGEVSAEEMVDNGGWFPGETANRPDTGRPSRRRSEPAPTGPKMAAPAQIDRIKQLADDLAPLTADELPAGTFEPEGLTFPQARLLIDTLEARKRETDGND